MKLDNLFKLVKDWGRKKNINNYLMQYAKINEEVGELGKEITRGHCLPFEPPSQETVDAIGDILVTVIIFADIVGIDPAEALQMAYNEIKGRKGKSIDGSFVKE